MSFEPVFLSVSMYVHKNKLRLFLCKTHTVLFINRSKETLAEFEVIDANAITTDQPLATLFIDINVINFHASDVDIIIKTCVTPQR